MIFPLSFIFSNWIDVSDCNIWLFVVYLAQSSPSSWDRWLHTFHDFEIIFKHCLSRYFSCPISSLLMQLQSLVSYCPPKLRLCSFFSTLFFFSSLCFSHLYRHVFKLTDAFFSCMKSGDGPIRGILCFLYCGFSYWGFLFDWNSIPLVKFPNFQCL